MFERFKQGFARRPKKRDQKTSDQRYPADTDITATVVMARAAAPWRSASQKNSGPMTSAATPRSDAIKARVTMKNQQARRSTTIFI